MRIAITGAQSTGKSTLLRYLKQDDDLKGFEFIDELTRKIAAKGININEEGSNMSQIFTVTIHAENIVVEYNIVIVRLESHTRSVFSQERLKPPVASGTDGIKTSTAQFLSAWKSAKSAAVCAVAVA